MNPFIYPKSKHVRTQSPPQYKNYRSYKPFLRVEFSRQCVYCRMPDTMRSQALFGADHYRPKHLFPQLENEYTNLLYCCNQCNSRKREYWPSPDRADKDFIPSPCDHQMYQHLRYRQGVVESKSDAGRFTIDLLDLNTELEVAYRENMLHMISVYEARQREFQQTADALRRLRDEGKVPVVEANQDLARIDAELRKTESVLKQLTGQE